MQGCVVVIGVVLQKRTGTMLCHFFFFPISSYHPLLMMQNPTHAQNRIVPVPKTWDGKENLPVSSQRYSFFFNHRNANSYPFGFCINNNTNYYSKTYLRNGQEWTLQNTNLTWAKCGNGVIMQYQRWTCLRMAVQWTCSMHIKPTRTSLLCECVYFYLMHFAVPDIELGTSQSIKSFYHLAAMSQLCSIQILTPDW